MNEIHCHSCGGFISDPVAVSYRLPVDGVAMAAPRAALCGCAPAVIYGPPPGWVTSGSGMIVTSHRN
jgi:hypothetical protein